MSPLTRATLLSSGFVLLGLSDLGLRFVWLERGALVCNPGVFWGLALSPGLILAAGAGLLGGLAWLCLRQADLPTRMALLAMLIGGSVNWVDRSLSGCVLDYFAWPLGLSAIFPNFNLADMLLLLGLLWLGWDYWKRSHTVYASQGIFGSDTGARRSSGRD